MSEGGASKKAVICAAMTKESLRKEITEMCMALIMGGNTDAFGAAKHELLTPLNHLRKSFGYTESGTLSNC